MDTPKWFIERYTGEFFAHQVVEPSPHFIARDPRTIFAHIFKRYDMWEILEERSEHEDTLRMYRTNIRLNESVSVQTWRAVRLVDLDELAEIAKSKDTNK